MALLLRRIRSRLPARFPAYYGWVMLPVAMLGLVATSPGQTFLVSVFNPFLRESLGLSHSQLTGTYMLGTLFAALPQPYFGALMDRFGIRRMLFFAVLLLGGACFFIAGVRTLVGLFFAFLGLRMFGQGAIALLASNTVAMWFRARLGTVAGISSMAFSAASAFLPAVVLGLITSIGWRPAYAVLGVSVLVVMLPVVVFIYHNGPSDVGQPIDGRAIALQGSGPVGADGPSLSRPEALRSRAFWIAAGAWVVWGMIATAVIFNIVPLFAASGLSAETAAASFLFLSAAAVSTQILGGLLADRLPLNLLIFASTLALAAGVWTLMNLEGLEHVRLYAVLFGIGQGLLTIIDGTLWARYYGRANLGRIRGVVRTAGVAGTSVGPFLMGLTFDLTGGYRTSLWIFFLLVLPLIAAALFASPPAKRSHA